MPSLSAIAWVVILLSVVLVGVGGYLAIKGDPKKTVKLPFIKKAYTQKQFGTGAAGIGAALLVAGYLLRKLARRMAGEE